MKLTTQEQIIRDAEMDFCIQIDGNFAAELCCDDGCCIEEFDAEVRNHLASKMAASNFDRAAAITEYAARFLARGCENETIDEAAEQCAADLIDLGAAKVFKREVARLNREVGNERFF